MTQISQVNLNDGQQAAVDGFFQFLFSEERELNISGPGGVGKTFVMGYLIDEIMPRYHATCAMMGIESRFNEVVMTAMTNKAADVLSIATNRPCQTIHSFMNLAVRDDYSSGKTVLTKTRRWEIHQNKIIFVDEASMIDGDLLALIREGTLNCKIVYVGDHCQLAPITESLSPIYRQRLPFYELTQPMRNSGQPALMAICDQLRNTVKTGEFHPIRIVPGVIDLLDEDQMQREIDAHFLHESDNRILAYTNNRVVQYNDYIRQLRQHTEPYTVGETLINNSAIQMRSGVLSVEEELKITALADEITQVEIDDDVYLDVRLADLTTKFGITHYSMPLPVNKDHFNNLIRYYKKCKNWNRYFHLKNTYPDLRPRDAATIHKAQGSTYDTVFVDLGNLSTCHNPNLAARLLYVAFTRARNRVVLFGDLAPKYGGLIY